MPYKNCNNQTKCGSAYERHAPQNIESNNPDIVCRILQQAGHLFAANVGSGTTGRAEISRGHPLTPGILMKEGMLLSKRKEPPRIAMRVTAKEKERILKLAEKCGLSASEYARQRALGYEPRSVLPDAFFIFCEKLDSLTESPFSKEVNTAALKLIRDMTTTLISPGKERDATAWQHPDSGLSEES